VHGLFLLFFFFNARCNGHERAWNTGTVITREGG